MHRESFFDIIFYIFNKWIKRSEKKYDEVLKHLKLIVYKLFLMNILYRNLFTLEPDLFSS